MKVQVQKAVSFKRAVLVGGAAALALGTTAANAAIDASVGTAFAALQADATSLAGTVTPIVVAILALALTIKLIKRFGNKI